MMPLAIILKDLDYSDPAQVEQCCYNMSSLESPTDSLFHWLENDADPHAFGNIGDPTGTWLEYHIATLQALGLDVSDSSTFYGMIGSTIGPTVAKYDMSCGGKSLAAGGSCEQGIKAVRYRLWCHMPSDTVDAHDFDVNLNRAEFSRRTPPGADGYAFSDFFKVRDLD